MLGNLQESVQKFVSENATVLLTGGGVVGTVATGALAWRGGFKAGRLDHAEETVRNDQNKRHVADPENEAFYAPPGIGDKIKRLGIHALPPIATGTATVAAIIFSHRMSAQKAAAMAALYGLSQDRFEEYRAKVEEKLTGPKAQAIKDEVAQDKVDENPPSSQLIVVEGKVQCFDACTGRYFQSTMEDIRKAVNATNSAILQRDGVSASYFYEQLGMPPTTWSDDVGWGPLDQVELEYTSTIAHNQVPTISIDFRTLPKTDWSRTY